MSNKCLNYAVMPANDTSLHEKTSLSSFEIYEGLKDELIPAINSISMITQMIDQETLGPVDLGPYEPYIEALKESVQLQEKFSQDLALYLRQKS